MGVEVDPFPPTYLYDGHAPNSTVALNLKLLPQIGQSRVIPSTHFSEVGGFTSLFNSFINGKIARFVNLYSYISIVQQIFVLTLHYECIK